MRLEPHAHRWVMLGVPGGFAGAPPHVLLSHWLRPDPHSPHCALCLPQGPSRAPLPAGSLNTCASTSGTPKSAASALPGNWARTASLRCHPKASISEPRELGPASASEQAVAVPAGGRAHIGQGCIPAAWTIALHPLNPLQPPCWWPPAAEQRPARLLSFPGNGSVCGEVIPSLTHRLQAVPRGILGSRACARPLAAFSPGSCSGQDGRWGCSPHPFLSVTGHYSRKARVCVHV